MKCTWEIDFKNCISPEAAAKAFVEEVNGTGFSLDQGPELELWASWVEDVPEMVVVGNHDIDLSEEGIHDIIDSYLEDIKKKVIEEGRNSESYIEVDDMTRKKERSWTTLWDRQNRRVLLLAGQKAGGHHWAEVKHDPKASVSGIYDIWRSEGGDVVFVEIRLDEKDNPLGFPDDLLSDDLLGSMTLWPMPNLESFIWWHNYRG